MVTHAKHANGQVRKRQGPVSLAIQKQTAKLPPNALFWIAGGAAAAAVALHLMKRKKAARFVAGWVPTILIGGVSHRLAKTNGRNR